MSLQGTSDGSRDIVWRGAKAKREVSRKSRKKTDKEEEAMTVVDRIWEKTGLKELISFWRSKGGPYPTPGSH